MFFWRNFYRSALVTQNFPYNESFWLHACTQALFFVRKHSSYKVLTVFWILLCLDNCSVICTVTLCYLLHQTLSEFYFILNSIYSGISRDTQGYLAFLRHIHTYWDIVKAYSGLFSHIQHPLWHLHIHNLAIFWALGYLEPEAYSKPSETLNRHIQNPAVVRTVIQALFSRIPAYSEPCVVLTYGEIWHIRNSEIFRTDP